MRRNITCELTIITVTSRPATEAGDSNAVHVSEAEASADTSALDAANMNTGSMASTLAGESVSNTCSSDAGAEQTEGMMASANEKSEKSALSAEVASVADFGELRDSNVVTNVEQAPPAIDDQSDEMSAIVHSVIASVVGSRPEFESALLKSDGCPTDERVELIKLEREEAEGPCERDTGLSTYLETIGIPNDSVKQALDSKEESKTKVVRPVPLLPPLPYTTDPNIAPETNIFDSHCHLDVVLQRKERVHPDAFEKFVKWNYKNFGPKFEGCITAFCNPSEWDTVRFFFNYVA